jgi:hypothetical protein
MFPTLAIVSVPKSGTPDFGVKLGNDRGESSNHRFRHHGGHPGLDHRKSDVSDLRPCKVTELGNTRVLVVHPLRKNDGCAPRMTLREVQINMTGI